MLGILPPAPWQLYCQMLPVPASMIFLCLLFRGRKQRKRTNIILGGVLTLLISMFIAGVWLQPIARVHRDYYEGKDQFEWAAQLGSPESEKRHEAVLALCEILKSSKSTMRMWIVRQLGHQGDEAKEALPVLVELLKDDDPILREQVSLAIKEIDASKVSNDDK